MDIMGQGSLAAARGRLQLQLLLRQEVLFWKKRTKKPLLKKAFSAASARAQRQKFLLLFSRRSAVLLSLSLAGCAIIPSSGPTRGMITGASQIIVQNDQHGARVGFALVYLNAETQSRLVSADVPPRFSTALTHAAPRAVLVGVGDVLSITVFESGSGGLFIPLEAGVRAGNFVQIPSQQVEQSGTIEVPYAGSVPAAGRTLTAIQNDIEQRLAGRALEPKVVVSIVERHANEISVLGDVTLATRFSMDASGERVLGAIARGEGPKFPSFETLVTVQRGHRAETALLSEIAKDPTQNIRLAAGDVVYVSHEPRYFLGIGATGATSTLAQLNRRFAFGDYDITLADGLALAGGLEDDRATPRGVFLYRRETRATLEHLGLVVPPDLPDPVPTIYTVNLLDPAGFFLTSSFWMRNHDTIYVSNAPITDWTKILNFLESAAITGSNARAIAN
jgi:polysaccharide export outer membrane protein